LNTASISVKSAAKRHGAIMGYVRTGVTAEVYSTYADSDKCSVAIGDGYQETPVINIYDSQDNVVAEDKMLIANSAITGDMATSATGLVGFDFSDKWSVVTRGTPILTSFEDEIINPDISWYDEAQGTEEDPYILYDKEDLYGFASLSLDSAYSGFSGKHIRLGDDIVVNNGDADDWAAYPPKYEWTPIGNNSYRFTGIFNGADPVTGEIHTISGLYTNASSNDVGLFGRINTNGSVSNLKLTNSHFETTASYAGSIAGWANNVVLNRVYSDANVICAGSSS
jgi:hypothetical protein